MTLISGNIKSSTGGPVPFATVTVLNGYFDQTGEGATANGSGIFSININPDLEPYALNVTSVGYMPVTVKLLGFPTSGTITLQPNVIDLDAVTVYSSKNKFPSWLLLLPLLVIASKKKGGKISGTNGVNPNTILMLGGGLIGLTVINKILVSLGIAKGKGARAVTTELQDPGSPWKPAYYKNLPAGTQYLSLTVAAGNEFSATIYNSFTLFKDKFDNIMVVFGQLKTKTQVSVLAEYFKNKYGRDLLTFLTDGGGILPWDGLSDSQFQTLTQYVNNLPALMP
jgi:hypothetical protein